MKLEILVDPLMHTVREINIADLATRGLADKKSINEQSAWQNSPSYLTDTRDTWPVTREFLGSIPPEEKLLRVYAIGTSRKTPNSGSNLKFVAR